MANSNNKGLLEYILLAFIPHTRESFNMLYNPDKFYDEIKIKLENYKPLSKCSVYSSVYKAKKRGYLKEVEEAGSTKKNLQLTPKGRLRIYKHISHDLAWDGKWRILFFDIPEKERRKRNSLRVKLKELGFVQYQLSAWICPFDCTKELEVYLNDLDIDSYVQYIVGSSIKGAHKFKKLFNLE